MSPRQAAIDAIKAALLLGGEREARAVALKFGAEFAEEAWEPFRNTFFPGNATHEGRARIEAHAISLFAEATSRSWSTIT